VIDQILTFAPSEELRRRVYLGSYQTSSKKVAQNVEIIDGLLEVRYKLANVLGYPSFAHFVLESSILRTPDEVKQFLESLALRIRPKLEQELQVLRNTKRTLQNNSTAEVQLWDMDFLQAHVIGTQFPKAYDLRPYLSIDNVLRGLDVVLSRVFSCCVEVGTPEPSENWCPEGSLVKLTVRDLDTKEIQGVIYLDLWERPNKLSGAEVLPLRERDDTRLSNRVAECIVSCDFSGQDCLTHDELEALFHEMGHATHIIFSRSTAQNDRPSELREIPSTLMEYFAWDHRVLSTFAVHESTGEVIPSDVVNAIRAARTQFAAVETMDNLILALLDQELHGSSKSRHPGNVYAAIVDKQAGTPSAPGALAYSECRQLTGSFYCYLLAQVYAAQIWHTTFEKDPFSSAAGTAWREQVLRHGPETSEAKQLLNSFLGHELSVEFFARDQGMRV
jgi:intermediate peptidase